MGAEGRLSSRKNTKRFQHSSSKSTNGIYFWVKARYGGKKWSVTISTRTLSSEHCKVNTIESSNRSETLSVGSDAHRTGYLSLSPARFNQIGWFYSVPGVWRYGCVCRALNGTHAWIKPLMARCTWSLTCLSNFRKDLQHQTRMLRETLVESRHRGIIQHVLTCKQRPRSVNVL